jgi:hypothetical protein
VNCIAVVADLQHEVAHFRAFCPERRFIHLACGRRGQGLPHCLKLRDRSDRRLAGLAGSCAFA